MKNIKVFFCGIAQAMTIRSVPCAFLILATTAIMGCAPEKKYSSLLEAEQACKEWAIKAIRKSQLNYPQNESVYEMGHINRINNPRSCNAETLTRQVIGLEYKGKIEADPLLSDKALMHFRY